MHPTPDLLVVAGYSPDAFRRLMRNGQTAGGRQGEVMPRMARGSFSNFTDDEIDAIYDYLVERGKARAAHPNATNSR